MKSKTPTVFIGSSSEGLSVANALKEKFSNKAEATIWDSGGVFTRNKAFLRSLIDTASLFDFAILIFSADDIVLKRDELEAAARDNVLFEFGLFLGRMGPRRAFAFVERSINIPTDLQGIAFDRFIRRKDGKPTSAFNKPAERLIKEIVRIHSSTAEFSHLPSTALAISYFQNFLGRVLGQLDDFEPILIDGEETEYSDFRLTIVLPDRLELLDDENLGSILRGLRRVQVNHSKFRDFPFYVKGDGLAEGACLQLFDIPTILRASRETVRRIFREEFVGKDELEHRAEQREVSNFEKTLKLLMGEKPFWERKICYGHLSEFV